MQKTKRLDFVVVCVLVYSLVFAYGFSPAVNAASLDSAKITLSDSAPSVSATSTIVLDLNTTLSENQYISILYDSNFGDPGDAGVSVTCPANTTASTTAGADMVDCTVDAGQSLDEAVPVTVVIGKLANPAVSDDYLVTARTFNASNGLIEYTEMRVYILPGVTVQAHVPASLTFTVDGLGPYSSKSTVNGQSVDATSTATSINFGNLVSGAKKDMAQSLAVSTNATGGFIVTVEQDTEMENAAGANINSFNNAPDGTGSSTAALATTWTAPLGDIARDFTYGHMGLTSDDATMDVGHIDFTGGVYAGFAADAPITVMYNGGVADGVTQNVGLAAVAYSIQISDLQEAGDYQNNLTYICTPTY